MKGLLTPIRLEAQPQSSMNLKNSNTLYFVVRSNFHESQAYHAILKYLSKRYRMNWPIWTLFSELHSCFQMSSTHVLELVKTLEKWLDCWKQQIKSGLMFQTHHEYARTQMQRIKSTALYFPLSWNHSDTNVFSPIWLSQLLQNTNICERPRKHSRVS